MVKMEIREFYYRREGEWRKMWIQGGCLCFKMGAIAACLYAMESLVEASNGSDPVGRECLEM